MDAFSAEVSDRGFEHADVIVSGHVSVQTAADALGMSHLAEHSAVRGSDAFNGGGRTVGVEMNVSARVAVQIDVLCSYLSVLGETADKIVVGEEASLTSQSLQIPLRILFHTQSYILHYLS